MLDRRLVEGEIACEIAKGELRAHTRARGDLGINPGRYTIATR